MTINRATLNVQVICGSNTPEREGSLMTGRTIHEALHDAGYFNTQLFDLQPGNIAHLTTNRPDVAFIAVHGGIGEDGTLQGLLDALSIPYVGSGVAACAVCKDKEFFGALVKSLGFNAPAQRMVNDALGDIPYPCVVKPACQGCSYGVFYVETRPQFDRAVTLARAFDKKVLVESYIEGRELTVGIFRDPDSGIVVLPPIETILTGKRIVDFQTKYPGGEHYSHELVPAPLTVAEQAMVEHVTTEIFTRLDCRGYTRMDMRLTPAGQLFVLENNTCPGMLSIDESDFPKMLQCAGITHATFVDKMVRGAFINDNKKDLGSARKKLAAAYGVQLS